MQTPQTTVEHTSGSSHVVLTNAKFKCTGPCGKWKPASKFGLRKMRSGTIRNQPRCLACRQR